MIWLNITNSLFYYNLDSVPEFFFQIVYYVRDYTRSVVKSKISQTNWMQTSFMNEIYSNTYELYHKFYYKKLSLNRFPSYSNDGNNNNNSKYVI